MSAPKKRIAIAGGGLSGMGAIYCLKVEGLEPICYERTPYFGGTWNYHDEDREGLGSVTWTTTTLHSKEMASISFKVPKEEYPNYMKHFHVLEMSQELADEYDIVKYIHYNHEVIKVSQAEDYEDTGRYVVRVRNNVTDEVTEDTFDGVLVCTGHITYPKMVTFPGMKEYKGTIMHTHSLKKVYQFQNQKVVVVGIGSSGLDAAVEISNVAKQVFLSTRSGAWIFPRIGPAGMPYDSVCIRRCFNFLLEYFPISVPSFFLEYLLNRNFNHDLYNLRPNCHVLCRDPSVSDFLPGKLINGSVVVRKNIKRFTERGVVFDGEEQVTEVDTVILATGYTWKFPFLDDGILTTERNGRINLYKCMYPAHLRHPTLAVIGFVLPFGAGFPLGEMQCRWAAHLLAGKGSLPSTDVMVAEVKRRHERNVKRYEPSEKMSVRVDFIPYLDSLATKMGAKPNLLKMAFRDPKLFIACFFGPCFPYQFRLEGPHSWPGAREAILTAPDRIRKPLMGSRPPKKYFISDNFLGKYLFALLATLVVFFLTDSCILYYLVAPFALLILFGLSVLSFEYYVI